MADFPTFKSGILSQLIKHSVACLFFAVLGATLCRADVKEEPGVRLSKFLYDLPVMDGMKVDSNADQERMRFSNDGEYCIQHVIVRSLPGRNITAREISDFYIKHFVGKGFTSWNIKPEFANRLQGPNIVTKGDAYVCSGGHITYSIPEAGNFASIWIEQRRNFSFGQSENLLKEIQQKFEEVAARFGFQYKVFDTMSVSDWPSYTANECFVERVISEIKYRSRGPGCLGPPDGYTFYFSVYPTAAHAEQWKSFRTEKKGEVSHDDKTFLFPPVRVRNIVVEYQGDIRNEPNADLVNALTKALEPLGKTGEAVPADSTGQD